ncbi:hypothetical protein [uncultured Tateyamaria sp.]|uniref:hypothetical protein n=1 Tax=uncultured Tateyamaria sp. TaxID=455651 RepID=UPI002634D6A5|nr:hypothetical protein [uncultured Tateyamaria sp.]
MLQGAQSVQTTPTYYEPETKSGDVEQHKLRVLIDEVATLRGLTIQMALRLMSLAAADTDAQRADLVQEFRTLFAQFQKNMDMLFSSDPPSSEQCENVEWIRSIVQSDTERSGQLRDVVATVKNMERSLMSGKVPSFDEARGFFDKNWPIVRDKMTQIIWDLWADLDDRKSDAMNENASLKSTLKVTLSDIKRFSTAIRMIAINTAVLASRPQESGAGFKVISQEVKQLSEDIDQSTGRANDALSGML